MKKLQILLSIFFVLNVVYAQNQVSLTFKYKFLNSNAGYTYPTKMKVYRNGNKIGQSSVKDQTEPNQVTVDFPKGNATITATVFAKVNNKWKRGQLLIITGSIFNITNHTTGLKMLL